MFSHSKLRTGTTYSHGPLLPPFSTLWSHLPCRFPPQVNSNTRPPAGSQPAESRESKPTCALHGDSTRMLSGSAQPCCMWSHSLSLHAFILMPALSFLPHNSLFKPAIVSWCLRTQKIFPPTPQKKKREKKESFR